MKSGEVHGDIRAHVFHHPVGHVVDLLIRIIGTRDKQGGEFQPDISLIMYVQQGI